MRHSLDPIFNPTGVAVVGASTVPHKTGGRRWRSMTGAGFTGPLYPIHPTATEVLGHAAYPSIGDLPTPIEMAVVIVPPERLRNVIDDCAKKGVRGIVLITGGLGETGSEGRRLERELVAQARSFGARIVGPNCAGLFSASGQVNALGWHIPPGPIAVLSQSGNMALTFTQLARATGIGISKLVTVGNRADISVPEYLDYFFSDPETKVVVAYLEGFHDGEGRALYEFMCRHPSPKPVVVLKSGNTGSGQRAALSHTGSLAGQQRIVDAALRQSGIIRVAECSEAWDAATALAVLSPLVLGSVAVISDGGGHATIVCDTADRAGLTVPPLSGETQTLLSEVLPDRSTIVNPVDFAGQSEEEPEVIPKVVDICLRDPGIGGAILAGHFGGYVNIATPELGRREVVAARDLIDIVRRHDKPFVLHTIYAGDGLPAIEAFKAGGIPVFDSLESAAKAMAACHTARIKARAPKARRSAPDRVAVEAILARAARGGSNLLLEPEARDLIACYGVDLPPHRVVASAAEATAAARQFSGPVVMKLVAPQLLHKTEAGGVILNVAPTDVEETFRILVARSIELEIEHPRVLLAQMIEAGLEVVVGGLRDPQFGPVVMFGMGGIHVDALDDVSFRLAPIDGPMADEMIQEIRSARLLGRLRDRGPRDLEAAADIIIRVSELLADLDGVVELDLNPIFLLEQGAALADARVILTA